MRVLWFASIPGLLNNNNAYNGAGWIGALQYAMMEYYGDEITLGIAYPSGTLETVEENGVTYYSLHRIRHTFFQYSKKEKKSGEEMKGIINDFRPDIIMCFGSEEFFGIVCTLTNIPVVIHLQGILNPLYEAWLPKGLSLRKYLSKLSNLIPWIALRQNIAREKRIFAKCQHFIGRTDWDNAIVKLMAPQATYHYGGELMRPIIYESNKTWKLTPRSKKRIVSIISSNVYKGGDVVLRTASLLREFTNIEFSWDVYGVNNFCEWERLTGINARDVSVQICGIITAEQLIDVVCNADLFVHPSYIENSPNTVCEAQILGIPVIATNTGGTGSIVEDGVTGVLVPVNAPHPLASKIIELLDNKDLALRLGSAARQIALERHRPEKIVKELMETYNRILEK